MSGSKEVSESPPIPERFLSNHQNDEEIKRKEKEALMKQLERFDENVRHAILLRREKDPKSEFYRKLETLNDRINAYKGIFWARQPLYMTINNKFNQSQNGTIKFKKVETQIDSNTDCFIFMFTVNCIFIY